MGEAAAGNDKGRGMGVVGRTLERLLGDNLLLVEVVEVVLVACSLTHSLVHEHHITSSPLLSSPLLSSIN